MHQIQRADLVHHLGNYCNMPESSSRIALRWVWCCMKGCSFQKLGEGNFKLYLLAKIWSISTISMKAIKDLKWFIEELSCFEISSKVRETCKVNLNSYLRLLWDGKTSTYLQELSYIQLSA